MFGIQSLVMKFGFGCSHRLALGLLLVTGCGDDTSADGTASGTTDPTGTTASPTTGSPTTESPTTGNEDSTSTGPGGDSSSDSGTQSSSSDGADSTGTTDGSQEMELGNTPEPCVTEDFVFPFLPDEAGHLAATILTPDAYPFEVTRVLYELGGDNLGGTCNSTLAHHVEVFITPDGVLTDAPSGMAEFVSIDVPEDAMAMGGRTVELELPTPIMLERGDSIVVAVALEANADTSASVCIRTCSDDGGIAGIDWWSNAALEPYFWADMVADFAFATNFTARAFGTVQ